MFTLTLQSGPAVLAIERLTVDGAVLRLSEALTASRWVAAELKHPALPQALTIAAKVTWSQPIAPGLALTLAALEFVGTWEALGGLRRAVLGAQSSRAYAGDAPAGYVVVEPGGAWACHGVETAKVAVVAREGRGFSVRRRDAREPLQAASFADALAHAFALPTPPRLDPPIEPPDAEAPRSGAHLRPTAPTEAAKTAKAAKAPRTPPAQDEAAVLAARTMVIGPERPPGSLGDGLGGDDEEAVLAARTMVVVDRAPSSTDDDDDAVLAARTVVLGKAPPGGDATRRWSKVLDQGKLVGWIAPDTPEAWSIYDERGHKTAIIAAVEGTVRVCWLGDKATESFEYFEAPTPLDAIVAAYELTSPPEIDPPIAGV